jgi:hypothetical protein
VAHDVQACFASWAVELQFQFSLGPTKLALDGTGWGRNLKKNVKKLNSKRGADLENF